MNKLFKEFKYALIAFLFLTIVIISFINYRNAKEIIRNKYIKQQDFVENSILQTVKHVSDAYKVAEKQINPEMHKYSLQLKYKYQRNPDIESWNLEKLKKEFGPYNIYIINQDLKIIRSTFKPDIGLDFSQYPGFSRLLTKRMKGNKLVIDRLDVSTKTGKIKKYSYMPTPDHKYLLELSLDVKEKFPTLDELDMFANAVDLTKKYDSVAEISFYKYNPRQQTVGELRNTKKPYINTEVSKVEKKLVKRVFESKQKQQAPQKITEKRYINRFLPLLNSNEAEKDWWNSFVIGIRYDTQGMVKEIQKHRTLFLINALIMVIIFLAFIAVVIHLLHKFEYLAYHDPLTELPNRDSFEEKMEQLISTAEQNNKKVAVLFLDIDDFKSINDNFGHETGDKVLAKTAQRLKSEIRTVDAISRLGGDEFAIAVSGINNKDDLNKVVERIINKFNNPVMVADNEIYINISVGISLYPDDGVNLEELLQKADYAMYEAKEKGTDSIIYE